jgi:hypothetical protein
MNRAWRRYWLLVAMACLIAAEAIPAAAATADAPRITKEEAKALLGAPKALFVDGRTESAWYKSDKKIKGAVRIDKWDIEMWASSYPSDTMFIVY